LSLSIGGEIIERIGNDCPTENNLFRCPQCIKWCESFFLYVLCFRALRAHFLIQLRKFSLCIHCLKKKKSCGFYKKNRVFSTFNKNKVCWRQIFEILIIYKPSLGTCEVPQKIGPDRFTRFDVYWIQTDKQSIYIYIDYDRSLTSLFLLSLFFQFRNKFSSKIIYYITSKT